MDTFVRNALRISLAGAGIVVLGASYIGQASAEEAPDTTSDSPSTATASPDRTSGSTSGSTSDPSSDTASPRTSEDGSDALVTAPTAGDLLAPDSLDSFVIPTASDLTGL